MNQRLGSDTIRAIASVIWVLFLSGWFILTTDQLADEGVYPETVAMGVWMGLMIVQIMIWGLVAYINWGIYSRLRQYAGSVWNALGFTVVVFAAVALPLGVASIRLEAAILGSSESRYVGAIVQVAGFLSVAPAMMVLHAVRTICRNAKTGIDADSVRLVRSLRRAVRPAVTSLGLTIAIAIITTSFIRDIMAGIREGFAVESQHVLLYGGFFTGVVFVLYLYAKSAVDAKAQLMVDDALPVVALEPADAFLANEEERSGLGDALGLGVDARESFGSLVVIAAPLLGAILTTWVAG
jgi:hypothetical protein